MKWPAGALAALTLIRFAVAAATPLSPDEAYYWTWSKALAPGYLDHPPMVALWIHLGTLLAGDDAFGVRLLAPLSALAGSILTAGAARDLLGLDRANGWAAAMLLNATLMIGVGSVTMTPDTPLLFFWTAALWCAGRAQAGSDRWLLGAGLALGLAFDSKYTGLLLAPALAIWLLTTRGWRRTLASPLPWGAALLSLLAVAPIIAWNAAHDFASFAKQGSRTADIHLASAGRYLTELAIGQLGLATPLVALLACVGTAQIARRALRGDQAATLLALTTLLPAAIFLEHAVGGRVQANWPSILYPSAAIAAAACRPGRLPGWRPAAALGFVLTATVYIQATLHPLALPGRSDVTLTRLAGWPDLAGKVARARGDLPLVADEYGLASELAWCGLPVLGVERRWSFLALPRTSLRGRSVLLIRSARRQTPPDPELWSGAVPLAAFERVRQNRVAERYELYRVTAAGSDIAAALPIRSGLSPR